MTNAITVKNWWTEVTKALLLGFIALAVLLHQTFIQGAGFVPTGASQLMLWVTVVGIVGYATLRRDLTVGYWLSALTGLLYLAFTGILMAGLLGPLPSDGPAIGFVLGPLAQGLYAVVLIVVAVLALRERGTTDEVRQRSARGAEDPQ
ncbi:hypothetical protein C2R22_23435 (plasmid) [Salinigranum rubrum]|uniref:Uncharacterized protein n=1 Tax=Salinigranum rubrum TaxID=755307 RepID=A0A2I8VRF4_9EURY|nr:hypothetical protein [Salinigranum rubrum]AUV84501.1 hypothetical protein C2R22_23435 [Salinigranum rubrum]